MLSIRKKRRVRRPHKLKTLLKILGGGVVLGLFIASMVVLIRYGLHWLNTKRESAELKAMYYASDDEPAETEKPQEMAATHTAPPEPAPTARPTRPPYAPIAYTWESNYPHNPSRTVSARIKKLQQTNRDIIGWLHIDTMLDEAIVQRDNAYYLRRDYKGYHNVNGALFLDQSCSLKNQPLLYMIYGHNMKTGAMFGNLRNWEDQTFYRKNPLIHFETMYEEGDYVVFSVGIFTEAVLRNGLLVYAAPDEAAARERLGDFVKALEDKSLYTNHVSVSEDDQLLLLITCDGKDNERRVLAARRVREDEVLDEVKIAVQKNRKK